MLDFIISFLTLRVLSTGFIDTKASENNNWDKDRMVSLHCPMYGETLLKHGRDTYGKKNTPLFSDYLEVNTLKAPLKNVHPSAWWARTEIKTTFSASNFFKPSLSRELDAFSGWTE